MTIDGRDEQAKGTGNTDLEWAGAFAACSGRDHHRCSEVLHARRDIQDASPSAGATPASDVLAFSADMLERPQGGPRREFERGMRHFQPATLGLVVACIAVFVWQIASGSLEDEQRIVASGALVSDKLLEGEAWRLGTSMFLHGSLEHLLGNIAALFILGIACEHAYGMAGMTGIYLSAGLAGGLASAAVDPAPTVGASGAIFGLMGCLVAMLARHQRSIHIRDGRIAVVVAVWTIWQIILGFASPMVANFAHLGGLVAGTLCGCVVTPRLLRGSSPI